MNASEHARVRRLMALVAVCLLGTTACGGGGGASPSPAPSPAPAPGPAPAPSPAPPPPAPTLSCASGWFYAQVYTNLRTPVRYWISDTAAQAAVDVEMQAQVRADRSVYNISGRHTTGRLRMSLWAIPANGQISKHGVVGHLIARTPTRMTGGSGADADQLIHSSVAFVKLPAQGTNPPAGDYCIALSLDEETATGMLPCQTQDRFCLTSWYTFDGAVRFQ